MTEYKKEIENLDKLIAEAKEKMDNIQKEYSNAEYYDPKAEQEACYDVYGNIEMIVCNTFDYIDTSFVMDCLWTALQRDTDCPAISKEETEDILETDINHIASEIYRLWDCRQNKYIWRTAVQ